MKMIVANWKSHPATLAEAQTLFAAETAAAEKYPTVQTIICPPLEFVESLSAIRYPLNAVLGTQDVFWQVGGDNFGVKYVLVGHSDRRAAGDTDEIINQKLKIALDFGVTPILLVGEKRRDDNREEVIRQQLTADLTDLTTSQVQQVIICYEPVWAISTNPKGEADTPENTLQAIAIIKKLLDTRYQIQDTICLYGGSVNSSNIVSFLSHPEISGAVIGRASLDPEEWANMLQITSKL